MNDYRVRAILITRDNSLLLIKRIKQDIKPYWVFPGGGVEDSDNNDFKIALIRELREELNAQVKKIRKPIYYIKRLKNNKIVQYEIYFLVEVENWSEIDRSGPEFSDESRGLYLIEEIPFNKNSLTQINIKPDEVKQFLIKNIHNIHSLPEIDLDLMI